MVGRLINKRLAVKDRRSRGELSDSGRGNKEEEREKRKKRERTVSRREEVQEGKKEEHGSKRS